MSGVRLIPDFRDFARTRGALRALAERAGDKLPLFREIGAGLLASTIHRFETQSDPSGRPWQPLSADTVIARIGGTKRAYTKKMRFTSRAKRMIGAMKILVVSAQLRDSMTYNAGPEGVEVGTNKVYGGIHQHGGQAGRGRKVTIPAREYLGLSSADDDMLYSAVARHMGWAA